MQRECVSSRTSSCGRAFGAVDLVDDDDRFETRLEGLRHARTGFAASGSLRQASISIDGTVGHADDAFDFAAEIGVSRAYR